MSNNRIPLTQNFQEDKKAMQIVDFSHLDAQKQINTNDENQSFAQSVGSAVFHEEQNEQERKNEMLAYSEMDKMKRKLQEFDQQYDTLIDYFAIIGFDNGQLRKLIKELIDGTQERGFVSKRNLVPSMLERFPSVDRPKVAFPPELVDFFLDMEERVLTKEDKNAYIQKRVRQNGQKEGEFYQQEVCTGIDGTIIYITAHMFFEDLAKVQASLPPKDILEDLNSKEEEQELDADGLVTSSPDQSLRSPQSCSKPTDESTKDDNPFAKEFVYQNKSEESDSEDDMNQADYFEKMQLQVQANRVEHREAEYQMYIEKNKKALVPDYYFVKKGFCIITHKIPASEKLNRINIYLRKAVERDQMFAKFEDYINNLIFSIPLPLREYPAQVQIYLPNEGTEDDEVLKFEQPSLDQLPYVNHETIATLFDALTVDNVMRLFKRVLLDTSNLFMSSDSTRLVNCCEAIKSLIFPFKYEVIYVPHLPRVILDIVDVPCVFMLGIEEKLFKEAETHIKDGTYIVDLDNNHIKQQPHTSVVLNRAGTTKDLSIDDLPDLPYQMQKNLTQKLKDIMKKVGKGRLLNEAQVQQVRECFFKFFVNLLQHYYVGVRNSDYNQQKKLGPNTVLSYDPSYLFHTQAFLARYTNEDPEAFNFLRVFSYMPLFQRLIQREAYEEDSIELGIFKTAVLQFSANHCFTFPQQTKAEKTKFDVTILFDLMVKARQKMPSHDKRLVGIDNQKLQNDYEKQEFMVSRYKYKSTPQYLDQQHMMKEFNQKLYVADIHKQFKQISMQEANPYIFEQRKQTTNKIVMRKQRIQAKYDKATFKTSIFLCWLLIWSSTFKYQEEKEKQFLTFQAITVLKKMFYRIDRDVADMIEVMMHSAFEHGTEKIVRFFFELYFDEFKLANNYTIHHYMISSLGKTNNPAAYSQTTHYELIRSKLHESPEKSAISMEEMAESFVTVDEEIRKTAQQKQDCQFMVYREIDKQHTSKSMLIQANLPKEVTKQQEGKKGFVSRAWDKLGSAFKRSKSNDKKDRVMSHSGSSMIQKRPPPKHQQSQNMMAMSQDFEEKKGGSQTHRVLGGSIEKQKLQQEARRLQSDGFQSQASLGLRKQQDNTKKQTSDTDEEQKMSPMEFSSPSTTDVTKKSSSPIASTQAESEPGSRGNTEHVLSPTVMSFVNQEKCNEMKTIKSFSHRTFFLPEEQLQATQTNASDKVFITLEHECPNSKCRKVLNSDRIMSKSKREDLGVDASTGNPILGDYVWYCYNCGTTIQPMIKARVGERRDRPLEEVPLFHPVCLRNLLETHLCVDINYRSVYQRDVDQLRQNRTVFWNLIYYFQMVNIPFEFIVPYDQSSLQEDLANKHLKVKSKQNLAELIQRYGYDTFKITQRQNKLMKENSKKNARAPNKGERQIDSKQTKPSGTETSVKNVSPHTPGAADSIPLTPIGIPTNTDPKAIKIENEAQKQQVMQEPRLSDTARKSTKKLTTRESKKGLSSKRESETEQEYRQRKKQQAKERSRRAMNQSF